MTRQRVLVAIPLFAELLANLAERFEVAPRMAYRALYRVALASL